MSVVVVVGAQWGDEGKGKIVDLLGREADVVARFGGGANAGHTLVIEGEQIITHLVPSGVMHPGTKCVLGNGMVIDPATLLEEIDALHARGLLAGDELLVSERAHVIFPYHQLIEACREEGAQAIGTTRRGIGPAFEAKAGRRGVRVGDLLRPARLRALVEQNLNELNPVIAHYGGKAPSSEEVEGWIEFALAAGERLAPHIGNAGQFLEQVIRDGKNVLFEGAQGALLDVDHGTYPFVTSSSTLAAGTCQGTGIGPTRIDRVIGITKAYTTRVGGGPFPTELEEEAGEALRKAGAEYGATTGRPRRCGWLDIPALRVAVRLNGMDGLALTKLDVLRGRGEIKLCVAYRLDGRELEELPSEADDLERAEPVFRTFAGFDEDISGVRDVGDLPPRAREYVQAIEGLTGVPFYFVSVGAERTQTIALREAF